MAVPMSVIATSGQRPFATGTALGGLALAAARLRTPHPAAGAGAEPAVLTAALVVAPDDGRLPGQGPAVRPVDHHLRKVSGRPVSPVAARARPLGPLHRDPPRDPAAHAQPCCRALAPTSSDCQAQWRPAGHRAAGPVCAVAPARRRYASDCRCRELASTVLDWLGRRPPRSAADC